MAITTRTGDEPAKQPASTGSKTAAKRGTKSAKTGKKIVRRKAAPRRAKKKEAATTTPATEVAAPATQVDVAAVAKTTPAVRKTVRKKVRRKTAGRVDEKPTPETREPTEPAAPEATEAREAQAAKPVEGSETAGASAEPARRRTRSATRRGPRRRTRPQPQSDAADHEAKQSQATDEEASVIWGTEETATESAEPTQEHAETTARPKPEPQRRAAPRITPQPATPTAPRDETGAPAAREAERRPARKPRRPRTNAQERPASTPDRPAPKPAPRPQEPDTGQPMEVHDLEEDEAPESTGTGSRVMLINVSAGDECRIAVLHENRLEELFIERESAQSHVGNIYKGRITNVESSIQAVFVDFGLPKNGFLHISDVQPQYFPNHKGEPEEVGRKIPRHARPAIQTCFRRGQEVIVQVIKEGVGAKGPTLTTYLSLPGRFLVMMPGMHRHGVSRKIEDDQERRQMRQQLEELTLPTGMGFILRTAGLARPKRELQRDLNYLLRLWKRVVERVKRLPAPAELYKESDLVTRTVRDVYTADFARVVVDDPETAKKAREFLQIAMPRSKAVVELYADREPLFHRFDIEREIEQIGLRHVPLPLGGSLVIDSTEALVAIDVNSGRFRTPENAEETAYQTNIEAAEEIARQLRLRDLGGLIVCDFIDMRLDHNKRAVEKALRDALKKHKERAKILRMSAFGLIEMTRQRQGPAFKRSIYFDCPHCQGSGQVKMPESVVLDVMRIVQLAAHNERVRKITVTVASEVAFQILNNKRAVLHEIEAETGKTIVVRGNPSFTADQVVHTCVDSREHTVEVLPPTASPRGGRR